MQEIRTYRANFHGDLIFKEIKIDQTDLAVGIPAEFDTKKLTNDLYGLLYRLRKELIEYIAKDAFFAITHRPHVLLADAPDIAKKMAWAGNLAGVGPMAAVAGAIAQEVGLWLAPKVKELVIENGGDIYLAGERERLIGIWAGKNSFSDRIALRIPAASLPMGVCTSSGKVGPSFSYGKADAAVVLAKDAALADATATMTGNLIKTEEDLLAAIEVAKKIPGILGVLAIINKKMAAWGEMELVSLPGHF